MKRLNIIIVAHEFSPTQGSECAVGWNIITNLSKYHNLFVIHAETNQFKTSNYESSINKHISINGGFQGLKLIPIPQPKITNLLVKINCLMKSSNSAIGFAPLYYAGYNVWQKAAFTEASRIIKENKIDIVHQLTSISFREPGYLWKFDVPFVWGPCSGLVKIPSSFYKNLKFKEISFELIRRLSNYLQTHFSNRIIKASKKASIIYTVTNDDYLFFKSIGNNEIRMMLDVGSYTNIKLTNRIATINNERLKLLWVGRLVYTKALDLVLMSLSSNGELNKKIELTIIGDGPLRSHYEKLSIELGLININWIGNISHDNVFEIYQQSDILIHSSIKEATSAVILEALTFGLPVICHDAFGMSYAINDSCGIKIPLISPEKSIEGFKEVLLTLIDKPELIVKLSDGALKRAKELSWDSMAETIANDYLTIQKNHESTANK